MQKTKTLQQFCTLLYIDLVTAVASASVAAVIVNTSVVVINAIGIGGCLCYGLLVKLCNCDCTVRSHVMLHCDTASAAMHLSCTTLCPLLSLTPLPL